MDVQLTAKNLPVRIASVCFVISCPGPLRLHALFLLSSAFGFYLGLYHRLVLVATVFSSHEGKEFCLLLILTYPQCPDEFWHRADTQRAFVE